jgi:anti-sigma-K factor RskA
MTDTPALTPEQEDDALAAEYVLGVLDLAERLAAEARARSDPGFAARIEAWEARLAPLNDAYGEAEVPPGLFARIEARLFPPTAPRPARKGWLGWALGGLAVAVAALAFFFLPLLQPGPEHLARLVSDDGANAYEATWVEGDLTVTRVAGAPAPAGQVHELWLIPPGGAPVSLGLLEAAPLTLPTARPQPGWTLAVTLEPAGGGPGGKPTGPVLMAAEIGT